LKSQSEEQSDKDRIARLERRQDAIAAKVGHIEIAVQETHETVVQIYELLRKMEPKANDNNDN
jgi:hypothetical protein